MREKSEPTAAALETFAAIASSLADVGVVEGAMFGARALTLRGKALACLSGDELAVKLDRDAAILRESLEVDGIDLFDPSGKGRPFKDWILVPSRELARWPELLDHALALAAR